MKYSPGHGKHSTEVLLSQYQANPVHFQSETSAEGTKRFFCRPQTEAKELDHTCNTDFKSHRKSMDLSLLPSIRR
jgi:hypothetical protein